MTTADWVLIDTGVWSAFFSKPGSREKHAVDALLDEDRVALTGPVLAEVLRGFRRTDQADWVRFRTRSNWDRYGCGDEAGRWPAMKIECVFPRALPWAGMRDAVGV